MSKLRTLVSNEGNKPLRVRVPTLFGNVRLSGFLSAIFDGFPNAQIEVAIDDSSLRDGELWPHVHVQFGAPGPKAGQAFRLTSLPCTPFAAKRFLEARSLPLHPSQLAALPCVTHHFVPPHARWVFLDREGKENVVEPNARFRTTNMETAKRIALAGHGVTWLPTLMIEDELKSGQARPILPGWSMPGLEMWVCRSEQQFLPQKANMLLDRLAEAVRGSRTVDVRRLPQ